MIKVAAPVLFLVGSVFAQNCLKYGAPTTLSGTLSLRDESGYNQFIVLRLVTPICTTADPKDTDQRTNRYRRWTRVEEVQVGARGKNDSDSTMLDDRLTKLVGHPAKIRGYVAPATSGYVRTDVQLLAEAIDPLDASGEQALHKALVEVKPKDVDAYDVIVNAGERLIIEVRESGATIPLSPSDQYFRHFMSGGQVLFLDCRDGYERSLLSSTEKDVYCLPGEFNCYIGAFPEKPIILKLRCTKKP